MMAKYNEVNNLIKAALRDQEKGKPLSWSVQGLGMLRLYLSPEWRLHVWDDRFATPKGTRLHDHPWDFQSYILSGGLTNVLYQKAEGPPTHYEQTIVCGPQQSTVGRAHLCTLEKTESHSYFLGESYHQSAEQIHDTLYQRGTVTLVQRKFRDDTEHARVYVPIVNPIPRYRVMADEDIGFGSNAPRVELDSEVRDALTTALLNIARDRFSRDVVWYER